ncbi:Hypothetical_protein [Hexamita inflata]|uniref:Hypothetical_protein n=1 Tax=Hexamita inflata TaxID=28002 RepID=A0AA86PYK1_9EUKA|nr:Hypothetical protein HINF_LOCUS36380 [Hexamita inflata]
MNGDNNNYSNSNASNEYSFDIEEFSDSEYFEPQIQRPITKEFKGEYEDLKNEKNQCAYYLENGSVHLNSIYINRIFCDIVNLCYSGNYESIDLTNIQYISEKIETIDLFMVCVNLNQFKIPIEHLVLQNCKITGTWDHQFICNQLTVGIWNMQQDISWITSAKYGVLILYFSNLCNNQFNLQILQCSAYQNLQKIIISQSTLNFLSIAQGIAWFRNDLKFKECILEGDSCLQVNSLYIIDCEISTSQLIRSQINSLTIQNAYEGSLMSFYSYSIRYKYHRLMTVIDDLPDVSILKITDCLFGLKNTSAPKVDKLQLDVKSSDDIPFSFFVNVKQTVASGLRQNIQQFYESKTNHAQIQNLNLSSITNLRVQNEVKINYLANQYPKFTIQT